MRIILEGPDNGGKTSLGRELVDALSGRVTYHMAGDPPRDYAHELECMEQQYEICKRDGVILDRVTSISQQIYNPSTDPSVIDARMAGLSLLLSTSTVIIYCRPSNEVLSRTEEFTWREGETEEHRQKIINNQMEFVRRYDEFMRGIPCLHYDYEDPFRGTLVRTIINAMLGEQFSVSMIYHLMTEGFKTWK